jgi:hypothetical protein
MVNGLTLKYDNSETTCKSDPTRKITFSVELTCSQDKDLELTNMQTDGCDYKFQYVSKKACPVFSYDKLVMFLSQYK